jgi:periplasmic glucans biosynthesis protein
VKLAAGQSTDLRAFLKAGNRTLTETWTYPWAVD